MRYLKERSGNWHYVRRVPAHVAFLDDRGTIQISLKTRSLDVAKLRRDAHERADDLYWQGLAAGDGAQGAVASYEAARSRARVLGFEYKAAADLAASAPIEELLRRLDVSLKGNERDLDAATGQAEEPKLSVTKAMTFYLETIAIGETKGMSENQVRKREEKKKAAAAKFVEIVGHDGPLLDVTRSDAVKYHKWWMERVLGKDGQKKTSGNTANRSFGSMRKLFREYASYLHLELKNPFDGLTFPDRKSQKRVVPPFEVEFIRDRILAVGAHEGLNREALAIMLVLVETGARPSEICNLPPERIHLKANVPYITVDYQEERVIKTESSTRDIPLMGVALATMRKFPNGFPRYRDKEDTLSATLMKHLRAKKLLPTPAHKVYSFRHSFEKRMLEAGLDYEFRKAALGHTVDREKYGDGGSMAWRLEQLQKIELPFDQRIVP
ncbi:hypothetical protein LCM4579_00690 [Ensifer sp. LCM 4579]|nr:hypothetical protein LCM4579_00690 [Ensifer sp. LCM 4579]